MPPTRVRRYVTDLAIGGIYGLGVMAAYLALLRALRGGTVHR